MKDFAGTGLTISVRCFVAVAWPAPCSRRVLRGGSWNNNPRNVRSANRNRNRTTNRNNNIGFRISRTPYAGTEVSKDLSGVPGRVQGRS